MSQMAVNTGFLKKSPLSPLSLSCHLLKLSQHSWENAKWMASTNDVICSPPGWNSSPGTVSPHGKPPCSRKQSQDRLQVGSGPREADSTRPEVLNRLHGEHPGQLASSTPLPPLTPSDEICRSSATQIAKLLSTLNLNFFITLLALL